jgi:hypothetical protein
VLGAFVFWAAYAAVVHAGLWPRGRAGGVVLLALAAACLCLAGVEGSEPRSLDVVYQHPAFVGNQVETKDFTIEVTQAPGYGHWLAGATFCAIALTRIPSAWPLVWAIAFAWLGTALALALEKLAAPPAVIALRLHGAAWLASILAAVAIARAFPRLLAYAAVLLLMINMIWLPSAVFGTLATQSAWGTSLDVHSIEFCAHRLAGTPLTLAPGSTEQLQHLLWLPLLVVFPLLSWFSAGGVGFLVLMAKRQRQVVGR